MSVEARAFTIPPTSSTVRSAVLITASEPEPRSFGKQVVMGGLLDHLCERLGAERVHVVLVGREGETRPDTAYRLHVVAKPNATEQAESLLSRVVLPPWRSLQEAALWSRRVRARLAELLGDIDADLQIWDTMRMGQYASGLPRRSRILYADDLFSMRYASMLDRVREDPSRLVNPLGDFQRMLPGPVASVLRHPAAYRPLLRLEQALSARTERTAPRHFDATVLVSADETAELKLRSGNDTVTTLLPLVPEPATGERRFTGESSFVFLGSLQFPPNHDGLTWFLSSCREAVLEAVPDFHLSIVGRGGEKPLPEAAAWGDHVEPVGWVDSLDDVMQSCAALLSPLRFGSGTKIKVLESLARGVPAVATRHGVLGLGVGRADGCLIGSTPGELARLLAEVVDVERNAALSQSARNSWQSRFAPTAVRPVYDQVLGLSPARIER